MAKTEEEKEQARAAKEAVTEKPGKTSAAVYTSAAQGGQYVRTYSIEEHGAGFIDLANQFAAKKGYEVRAR